MARILGIDPGSRVTGFGVIEVAGTAARYLASGVIRTEGASFPQRLRCIFEQVTEVIERYAPDTFAIEQVFVNRNVESALKLGQARGVAICAGVMRDLPIAEYSPSEVKQAVVGTGAATKEQVQYMVRALLSLNGSLAADAADALAVALCHHQHQKLTSRLKQTLIREGRP